MFRLSISHFESELKGVYECVASTVEAMVSTAVKVVITCKLIDVMHTSSCNQRQDYNNYVHYTATTPL